MKRVGYVYEQMSDWVTIVEAEAISTKRKGRNRGVIRHQAMRWKNLVEIQESIIRRDIHTGDYEHEQRVSGQDKLRDIAKLLFHPSHIQHQLLTMVADRRIDKALVRHTYASRKGYGQTKAALRIRDFLREHRGEDLWCGQGDIVKYYDNIRHALLRENLSRMFKDKDFVDAFIEPFEKFSDDGKSIPLGIRPSQAAGNVAIMKMDRLAMEELRCMGYMRYLDDFVFFGKTKGEVKWKMKRLVKCLNDIGFEVHEPKIHRLSEGLDTLGYVYYGTKKDMFWRKSDKKRWLARRSRVTNKRRIQELDNAAWGQLKWGNRHCKKLFFLITGEKRGSNMGVTMSRCGMKKPERKDENGVKFIEAPVITMENLRDKGVEVLDWVKNIKTENGPGRYALKVLFYGDEKKVIVNSIDIKALIDEMDRYKVTRFKTIFVPVSGTHAWSYDRGKTEILEIDGRMIAERDGKVVFEDSGEEVIFEQSVCINN